MTFRPSPVFPLTIPGRQQIADKALIGDQKNVFWPGSAKSTITVENQQGVLQDIAVALALTSWTNQDGALYVTLINPGGIRVPLLGTNIDSTFKAFDGSQQGQEPLPLYISPGSTKSWLLSSKTNSINDFEIDQSIKEHLVAQVSALPLASFEAFSNASLNGDWQLEVRNSSDAPVRLDEWQLFIKSAEVSTQTDAEGFYSFKNLNPSSVSGFVRPWLEIPSDRSLLSPAGGLNSKLSLLEPAAHIRFGLSNANQDHIKFAQTSRFFSFDDSISTPASSPVWPWLKLSNNRSLLSPVEGLNSSPGLFGPVPGVGHGFSVAYQNPQKFPISTSISQWSDSPGLVDSASLHPKTTINQAVTALNADGARAKYGVDGSGVKVGIISDSFNLKGGLPYDIQKGLLPEELLDKEYYASHILEVEDYLSPGAKVSASDEGRAMMQLAMSIAPGAEYFFSASSNIVSPLEFEGMALKDKIEYIFYAPAEMARRIDALVAKGCDIIVDDMYYPVSPFFQDGPVSLAIKRAEDAGVVYFTAASNQSNHSYESEFAASMIDNGVDLPGPIFDNIRGKYAHNFGSIDDPKYFQAVQGSSLSSTQFVLQWDEPWGSSGRQLSLHIYDENFEPVQVLSADGYPAAVASISSDLFYVAITGDTPQDFPNYIKWVLFTNGRPVQAVTPSNGYGASTNIGHSNPPAGAAIGAVNYWSSPNYKAANTTLSNFSSWGVTPVFFDPKGVRLQQPEFRRQPFISAPQHGDTSFFSLNTGDPEVNYLLNFSGTSAAAPNVAAIAALMLQFNPELSPPQIFEALRATATSIEAAGSWKENDFSNASGYGLVNAMAAFDDLAQFKLDGYVYEDSDRDGILTSADSGLGEITVFLDGNANGRLDQDMVWQSYLGSMKREANVDDSFSSFSLARDQVTGIMLDSGSQNLASFLNQSVANRPAYPNSVASSNALGLDVSANSGAPAVDLDKNLLAWFGSTPQENVDANAVAKLNPMLNAFGHSPFQAFGANV